MIRLDAKAAALDQIQQPVLVARQPEEPIALDDRLGRLAVLRTKAAGEIAEQDERLAARAVEALVVALVEIARFGAGLPEPLDAGAMAWVGARANIAVLERVVVGAAEEASG